MAQTPYLTPVQEARLIKGTDIEPGTVVVYREYRLEKDSIEYTIYYRVDGEKKRVDIELFSDDLLRFGEGQALEDNVAILANTVIRSHMYRGHMSATHYSKERFNAVQSSS